LHDHADRLSLSGFSEAEGSPLLLAALVDGERLAERLLANAIAGSISASERNERLQALRLEETRLRYDEEASICAAASASALVIGDGGDKR
jgi:hypothetical protein